MKILMCLQLLPIELHEKLTAGLKARVKEALGSFLRGQVLDGQLAGTCVNSVNYRILICFAVPQYFCICFSVTVLPATYINLQD